MTSLSFGCMRFPNSETRVHDRRFFHDQPVGIEFANILAGIRIGNFAGFVGVKPNFTFAYPKNFGRENLLRAEVWHCDGSRRWAGLFRLDDDSNGAVRQSQFKPSPTLPISLWRSAANLARSTSPLRSVGARSLLLESSLVRCLRSPRTFNQRRNRRQYGF
jgi:hypothetical protein